MRETPILRKKSRKGRCAARFIRYLYLPSHKCYRERCLSVPKQGKLAKRIGRLLYQIKAMLGWCKNCHIKYKQCLGLLLYQIQATGCWRCRRWKRAQKLCVRATTVKESPQNLDTFICWLATWSCTKERKEVELEAFNGDGNQDSQIEDSKTTSPIRK